MHRGAVGGDLTLGPVQNQVLNLPYKCQLKLAGLIMVEAVLLIGVLLRNIGSAAAGLQPLFLAD